MARLLATRVEIDAPAAEVWAILTDLDRYAEWNPFTPKIETDFTIDGPITLHVSFDGGPTQRRVEVLRRWAPGEELRWTMTMGPAWFFRSDRTQRVEPLVESLGATRCRYVSELRFAGLFAPVVTALYGAKVQRGLDALAAGLRRRAQ
jgi:uncharacterized protein YndB with AHSA1/START domain